jgi:predicted transcriptional regulator
MLSVLLGSKNAERVLLFLLVNEQCYASEIQKTFNIPLTPLQSMIQKLEKAGVLTAETAGKKKLCRLNPDYPLHRELKDLLKTAFVHLPSEEKRLLFSRKAEWHLNSNDQFKHKKRIATCLHAFCQRLEKVHCVSIQTQSAGQAFGNVLIKKEKPEQFLFMEKGQWVHEGATEIEFSKTLRWTVDYSSGMIALEHLHYGSDRPVFLFHLVPTGPKTLQSIDSHLCRNDCYFGRIEFNEKHIRFLWRILGPRKNEILYHIYG